MRNKFPNYYLFNAFLVLIFIFTLGVTTGMSALPNSANVPNVKSCKGLDIVILVSSSTSTKYNDEVNLRRRAIMTALDILGDNAIYFCPGVEHRIAVVGFGGGETKEFIPLTTINPSMDTRGEWEGQEGQKTTLIKFIPESYDLAKDPNIQDGVKKASDILSNLPKIKGSDPYPRKQAVLIISDGNMCTTEYKCDMYDTSRGVYQDITPIVNPGSTLGERVQIDFIGIYNTSGGLTQFFGPDYPIRDFWTKVTGAHGGQFITLNSKGENINRDIDAKVALVFKDLLGSLNNACENPDQGMKPVWVEPYLNNFLVLYVYRFSAFKGTSLSDVNVSIEITRDDGTVETIVNGKNDYEGGDNLLNGENFTHIPSTNDSNEKYVFYQPPAGKYVFKVENADPCRDVSVLSGSSGVTAQISSPTPEPSTQNIVLTGRDFSPYYDENNPDNFAFQLFQVDIDGKSSPLKEVAGYPLSLSVYVKSKEGAVIAVDDHYDLILKDKEKAIYEAEQPISLRYPGEYTWELVATTNNVRAHDDQNPDTTPVEILTLAGELTIKPLDHNFDFKITSPEGNTSVFMTDKTSSQVLPVQVQVYEGDSDKGAALRQELRISDASQSPLIAKLFSEENGSWTELASQPMTWASGNLYSADLAPGQFHSGQYKVVVTLTDDYNNAHFHPIDGLKARNLESSAEIQVSVVTEQPFTWVLQNPKDGVSYPTRPVLNWFASPKPPALTILASTETAPAAASSMARKTDASLFEGTLVNASTHQTYSVSFKPDSKSENSFVADWPKDAPPTGRYILQDIRLNKENLQPMWIPGKLELPGEVQFGLKESPWTMPWSLLAAMILVAMLIMFFAMLYLVNGPLAGCELLFASDARSKHQCNGQIKVWGLFSTRKYTVSQNRLDSELPLCQISSVDVNSTRPTEDGSKVAVDVMLHWQDGDEQSVPNIHEIDGPVMIAPGITLKLLKEKYSFIVQSWKFILMVFVSLVIWFAVFSYLYFNA